MIESQTARDADSSDRAYGNVASLGPFGVRVTPWVTGTKVSAVPVHWLRELVARHKLVVVRGYDDFSDAEDFRQYSSLWGPLLEWDFGTVLEIAEDLEARDTVFDSSCIPLHWDAMFNALCPKFILFNSVKSPDRDAGGRTTFCDTERLLARAAPETVKRWRECSVSYAVPKIAHYHGTVESPLVVPHPDGSGREVLRFGEPEDEGVKLLNPVVRDYVHPGYASKRDLIAELKAHLHDPHCLYAHEWNDGDLLIADNYGLLHGREAFARQTFRHLRRTQVLTTPPHRNRWTA